MMTIEEAVRSLEGDYWDKSQDLVDELSTSPYVLRCALHIAADNSKPAEKICKALIFGIAVGMAMEKQSLE